MIRTYRFRFDELNIEPADIEEIMGYETGCSPDPFPDLYDAGLKMAAGVCDIHGGYRILDEVVFDSNKMHIRLETEIFSPGKIVFTQLKNALSAALFLCTAGKGITLLSHKTENEGDPMLGYILDVIGSVTVEKAVEKIHEKLGEETAGQNLKVSDRYSPGYCDWSVAEQQLLFSLLPENFCGISLSGSSLMDPIKSVSGIIGIGPEMEMKGYQCHWCNDTNCLYGRIKRKRMATFKSAK